MSWLTKLYDATWGRAKKGKKEADAPPPDDEEDGKGDDEDDPDDEEKKGKDGKKKAEGEPKPDGDGKTDTAGDGSADDGKKAAAKTKPAVAGGAGGSADETPIGSHALFLKLSQRFGTDFAALAFRDGITYTAALDRHDQLMTARNAELEKRLVSIGKLGEDDPPSANLRATQKPDRKVSLNAHIDHQAAWLAGGQDQPDPAA